MSDRQLRIDAERWMAAMMRPWEPLGHMPHTPAESAALALEAGLERDWAPGTRLELIYAATCHIGACRPSFLTLALRDWPKDLRTGESVWLMPCQLAWAWDRIELSNVGLPEGVGINDLPQPSAEQARAARVRAARADGSGSSGGEEVASVANSTA